MIIWILSCILDLLFNVICYLTNPIVVLFANEVGELPKIFYWWDNWDDGLDIEWMITEHHVPKWAEYDFNRHYKFYSNTEAEAMTGTYKSFVVLLDPNFTLKERFQRYICRLQWLYRNCAYGFSYSVTGRMIDGSKIITKKREGTNYEPFYIGHYKNWLFEPFCIKIGKGWYFKDIKWLSWIPIKRHFLLEAYLGYKFYSVKPDEIKRCMLTISIWPFFTYRK